jgi:hypothetical protein
MRERYLKAAEGSSEFAGATGDLQAALHVAGIEMDNLVAGMADVAISGRAFMDILSGNELKLFNEDLDELGPQMVLIGGHTADQNRLLREAQDEYESLGRKISEMQAAPVLFGKNAEEAAESIQEWTDRQAELVPLIDQLGAVQGTANMVVKEATVDTDALTLALFEQMGQTDLTAAQLAIAGNVLGVYNDQQLDAALKAAIMEQAIADVAAQIAAGDSTVLEGRDKLLELAGSLDQAALDALEATEEINAANQAIANLQDKTVTVTIIRNLQDVYLDPDIGPGPRQHGGPVSRGHPYIVGEVGPELFVPDTAGTIIPNHELGSGGGGSGVATGSSVVNNYEVTIVNQTREAAALALATVHERRRQSMNQYMGV